MTTEYAVTTSRVRSFTRSCSVRVHLPGDPGYDEARTPWNVAVDQRPAAVAYPVDADEVGDVVRAAAAAGLRVAPQGTGHNAGPLGSLDDVVLLRTSAMTGVIIDPERRVVRVEAGVLWLRRRRGGRRARPGRPARLLPRRRRRRLLPRRRHRLVRPAARDGHQQRDRASSWCSATAASCAPTPTPNPTCSGRSAAAAATSASSPRMELRLFDIETAYAGMLVWDQEHAERVLRTWAAWTERRPGLRDHVVPDAEPARRCPRCPRSCADAGWW